jgi:hypothetical protein
MFLLLIGNVSDMLFDLFPIFLYDETVQSYNSFNYQIIQYFLNDGFCGIFSNSLRMKVAETYRKDRALY